MIQARRLMCCFLTSISEWDGFSVFAMDDEHAPAGIVCSGQGEANSVEASTGRN